MMRTLIRTLREDAQATGVGSCSLQRARERILTTLTAAGALFGALALLITFPAFITGGVLHIFPIYVVVVCALWVMALGRNLPYYLRAATLLLSTYLLGLTELLNFGYTVDGHAYLIAGTLLGVLFFNQRIGIAILLANTLTLLGIGGMIATGRFVVWEFLFRNVDLAIIVDTGAIFISVVGALQFGIAALLRQLDTALQEERQLRDQLEVRVAERTHELALAHDKALVTNRELAEQRAYMDALYETTLDLLNRRQLDDLLQSIVERATTILDAPYGELMLKEGDTLVVCAYTANQAFLKGDRVGRHEARLSWQACDSGQPVVFDDYAAWAGHRDLYEHLPLRAVADFPIMVGDTCQGVLALGRAKAGHVFTVQDTHKGQLFSQLIALVLENARLYETAQREIAERTEVELALQQSAHELQAQNADLDAFGHTVAHDLKNPLSAIMGYGQILQLSYRMLDHDSIERYLQMILTSGKKMTSIINELLLLAHVRRTGPIAYEALDMAAIIAEMTTRLARPTAEAQACLRGPPIWPAARGYAPWVEEVWVNYVSNALKYGGTPPQILLGADPPAGGFVRFWVRDNGPGIASEQQELLFTAFTRLQPARVDGHGLGLSIVQRITEKLGGSVGVESTPGVGSTFSFTLPVA
jgi:signal transduction histidine kinase